MDDCEPGQDHLPFSNDDSMMAKSMLSSGESRIANAKANQFSNKKYNPLTDKLEDVCEMPIENDSSLSGMIDSSNPSNREESSGNVGST